MTRQFTPALSPEPRPREISERVNAVLRGKINSTGSVTLNVSSSTTTLNDANIGLDSMIFFTPLSNNARNEGIPWVQITSAGSATLRHGSNVNDNLNFAYLIVG